MSFSDQTSDVLVYMASSAIGAVHAFTTRLGGVSTGIFDSLNLGQNLGDEESSVRHNYCLLGAAVGFDPGRLVYSRQVHGHRVRTVTSRDCIGLYPDHLEEADALVTDETDVALIVFTADCVPILLHDPETPAVGAVHAGWRGTVADIAGEAVRTMTSRFGSKPEHIRAAIGPCISPCCFLTDRDVPDAVIKALGDQAAQFIQPSGHKFSVDLKGVNACLLERAGLNPAHIDVSEDCTSCQSSKYWSHRATSGLRGSQAAVIMLKGIST